MRAFVLIATLSAALLLQSALTQVAPAQARLFDPFLIVVVYFGLAFGESYGMFAGMLAGWIQDVFFGGTVAGLTALSKILPREPWLPLEAVQLARHKMYFDSSKAVRELGLPQTPVEEALRRAVDWYRANGYA